jgi:hypothetical protein
MWERSISLEKKNMKMNGTRWVKSGECISDKTNWILGKNKFRVYLRNIE